MAGLSLVCDRVGNRVNVEVVAKALEVGDLDCSFLVETRKHSIIKALLHQNTHFLFDVELEKSFDDCFSIADCREGCDRFEGKVANLFFAIAEELKY